MTTLALVLLANLSAQEEGLNREPGALARESEPPGVEVILSLNMGACLLDLSGTVKHDGSKVGGTAVPMWVHFSPYLECWFDEQWGIGLRYEFTISATPFTDIELTLWDLLAGYRVLDDPSHRLEILGGVLYGEYDYLDDAWTEIFTLGLVTAEFPGEYRPGFGGHLGVRYNWQVENSFQLNVELAARYLKFRLIEEDGITGDDVGGWGFYYSLGFGWNF